MVRRATPSIAEALQCCLVRPCHSVNCRGLAVQIGSSVPLRQLLTPCSADWLARASTSIADALFFSAASACRPCGAAPYFQGAQAAPRSRLDHGVTPEEGVGRRLVVSSSSWGGGVATCCASRPQHFAAVCRHLVRWRPHRCGVRTYEASDPIRSRPENLAKKKAFQQHPCWGRVIS